MFGKKIPYISWAPNGDIDVDILKGDYRLENYESMLKIYQGLEKKIQALLPVYGLKVNTLRERGVFFPWKRCTVHRRSILKHLQRLEGLEGCTGKTIPVMDKIWQCTGRYPPGIFSGEVSFQKIKKAKGHRDWIYSQKPSDCPHPHLRKYIEEWYTVQSTFNGLIWVNILSVYERFGPAATVYLLLKDRNKVLGFLQRNERELLDRMKKAETKRRLREHLSNPENLAEYLSCPFDALPDFFDEMSIACLTSMWQAVEETEGAKEWLRSLPEDFRASGLSHNPTMRKLSAHPAVDAMGHSGMTMSWSIGQVRWIAKRGWDYWMLETLREMKILPSVEGMDTSE